MRWHLWAWALLLSALPAAQAMAELRIDACLAALRKSPGEVKCHAAYKTTTPAELELLSRLSYGLVQVSTCDVALSFDFAALAAQYRPGSRLKLKPVQLNCSMQTRAANLPIQLVATTHVRIAANGVADAFVAEAIDVVGYPDIYQSQILRFVNDNADLGRDVTKIFNENLSVLAGRPPQAAIPNNRSVHAQSDPR